MWSPPWKRTQPGHQYKAHNSRQGLEQNAKRTYFTPSRWKGMRLITISESTTERSASGMSVCDVDLCIWAAKVCITASGSGSTSTDTRLCNASTAKNRVVYYEKGQHTTHVRDIRAQPSTSSTILYPILQQLKKALHHAQVLAWPLPWSLFQNHMMNHISSPHI